MQLLDTVEIDHNSFCTVLQLCNGPDLFMYLKQHKMLPEKEAKLIISQILSGLKYLNEQKEKIIHFVRYLFLKLAGPQTTEHPLSQRGG